MNDYWLTLFAATPRRIRVIENLLRNRLSAATVFWTVTYGIEAAVGAARHLRRADYEAWLRAQVRAGWLQLVTPQTAVLTSAGQAEKATRLSHQYRPQFGRWAWRVNVDRLAPRLLLAIQVTSELAHHQRTYRPLNIGGGEMEQVKQWALTAGPNLAPRTYQELRTALTQLAQHDDRLATILTASLIGYQTSGQTRAQLAAQVGVTVEEGARLLRDAWLGLASQLAAETGPLAQLVAPLIAPTPLSASALETLTDFQAGQSLPTISARRHRKLSTIREHLLLAALLMPQAADYARLIPPADQQRLATTLPGPPASWSFVATGADPSQEFFVFRLYQILRTVMPDGQP